mgnify:CR=1 FL=1
MEHETNMLQFDDPLNQSSYIKVIGVGGGGGNAVNHMFRKGITGVDFIVCNTDAKHLMASPVQNKIVLGQLGAGNNPAVARQAALDHESDIREALSHNTQMLFITAGMGGGTGTGAAPVIARIAKDIELEDNVVNKILVVAVVTTPFRFEGKKRNEQAEAGIAELRKHVDSILVINNDKLRAMGDLKLGQGFGIADDVLLDAVKGIAEIITKSSYVSVDFRDVNTVMQQSGTALMGTGIGKGENRAIDAITAASTSVLLNDNDIRGAQNVLLYFSYHPDHEITFDEIGEVTDHITECIGNYDANIIWGTGEDDSLGDELKITLVATGYEAKKNVKPNDNNDGDKNPKPPIPLGPVDEKPVTPEVKPVSNDPDGFSVVTKPTEQPKAQQVEDEPVLVAPEPVVEAVAEPVQKKVFVLDVEPEGMEPEAVEEESVEDLLAGMKVHSRTAVEAPAAVVETPMVEVPVVEVPVVEIPVVEAPIASAPMFEVAPARPAGNLDASVSDRAERIRLMNELLHTNAKGPDIVANMGLNTLRQSALEQPKTSSQSESATMLDAAGNMNILNNFLFQDVD